MSVLTVLTTPVRSSKYWPHSWGAGTNDRRTGKILYALGNVLEHQGRLGESLCYHLRCLKQYKKTPGNAHHRTGDVCHKLAGHYIRRGVYKEAE